MDDYPDVSTDAVLTLQFPLSIRDENVDVDKEAREDEDGDNEQTEGKVESAAEKQRRSLDELLAAAEKEFDLMDSVVDSAVKTLKNGREVQKLAAIRNFGELLESAESRNDAINRVLPVIQEILAQEPSNLDIHCESAVVFKNIIRDKKHTDAIPGLTDKLLDYILQNVENQKENVTAAAWLESLVEIADSIPVESVVELIVPLAISQAEPKRRVQRRVIAARLVEKLATIIPSESVRRDLIPCAQMLCRDPSAAVRTTISQRLSVIAQALNNSADCVSLLLPCLIELCKDDDAGVREAVLNTIAVCLPYLTKESRKTAVVPLLRKCAEQALLLRDASLAVVARQLGPWLTALRDVLSEAEQRWFLDTYSRIIDFSYRSSEGGVGSSGGNGTPSSHLLCVSCRRMCAYNFPCFAMVYAERYFNERLMPTLERFARDTDDEVRATIAASFHEIVQLRAAHEQSQLTGPFVELLCSGAAEVVQHLTAELHRTLPPLYSAFAAAERGSVKACVATSAAATTTTARRGSSGVMKSTIPTPSGLPKKSSGDHSEQPITRIQLDRILIGCNRLIRGTGSWRSHEAYLTNIAVVRQLIPLADLYATFVPMLQQEVLTARALPCRIAAAQTLLLMMREFPTAKRRIAILEFFTHAILHHESCHRRRLLLDVVPFLLEHFSREFFIAEFFPHVLSMAHDRVSNIRLQLCRTLTRIKRHLVFPANGKELSAMEAVVRDLLAGERSENTRLLIQQYAVELSRAETELKETPSNKMKLLAEKQLWTESDAAEAKEDTSTDALLADSLLADDEGLNPACNALRRSATTNLVDGVLSERAASLAAAVTSGSAADAEAPYAAVVKARPPVAPSNWRMQRPDRPRLAVVRPQPQVVITQRSPSPMPTFASSSSSSESSGGKKSGGEAATATASGGDEKKSKLPLAAARYRSAANTTTTATTNTTHSSRESAPNSEQRTSSQVSGGGDGDDSLSPSVKAPSVAAASALKKYRPPAESIESSSAVASPYPPLRTSASSGRSAAKSSSATPSARRRPSAGSSVASSYSGASTATTTPKPYSAATAAALRRASDSMTRSPSSAFMKAAQSAAAYSSSSSANDLTRSTSSAIRRPYGLMKVQSTSAVERKPSQMSIRVTSMS